MTPVRPGGSATIRFRGVATLQPGDVRETAEALGIDRSTLYQKTADRGIET